MTTTPTAGRPGPGDGRPPDHRRRRALRGARTAAPRRGDQLRRGHRRRGAARAVPRHRARRSTRRRASPTVPIPRSATSGRRCRRGGDGRPPAVRDRATAHLPALLYERLDELGIDFTILYPSMALGYFEVTDEELSSVLCRAVNRYHARLFAPYRDRCTVGALIPMNTPAQAVAEAEYAVRELGAKSVLMAGYARRPIGSRWVPARHVRARQRLRLRPALGGVRRPRRRAGSAQRVAAAPRHAVDLELRVQPRQRPRRRARVAVQVAVPRRRHPSVPRAAHRLPRGRRGVGVRAVRRARRSLGEAQPRRDRRARSRPARRRRPARVLRRLRRRLGVTRRHRRAPRLLRPSGRASRRRSTSSRPSASTPSTTSGRGSSRTSTSGARPTTRWWRGRSATTSTRSARGCARCSAPTSRTGTSAT